MAPLPISLEAQELGPLGPGQEYNFPSRPGPPMPRAHHPSPTGGSVPDVDDVFVVAVSLVVVASLTIFVVYQAIGALKEMMDTRPSPFSALSISSFRKHGWNSLTSSEHEQLPLLCPSNISIDTDGCRRNSRWVGEHRCQFTLSPDPYEGESDTSSTLTRSSSDSTVVGGRVCVVYDDTIEPLEEDGESDEEDEEGSEEEEEEKSQYRRPMYEPRTRVRRQAIFST